MSDVILLDIEGTTTPIEFVYRGLFPYAKLHLREFFLSKFDETEIQNVVGGLFREYQHEKEVTIPLWVSSEDMEGAIAYLQWLMEQDRKSTGLKAIQGRIWETGFVRGDLKGELFDDVPEAFARWTLEGKKLYIFSSGSVLAQKLMFRYSSAGDLSHFLSGYFDTETGAKRESKSYSLIASKIGGHPEQILFISDVSEELDAARGASLDTRLAVRPGNNPADGDEFQRISSFEEI